MTGRLSLAAATLTVLTVAAVLLGGAAGASVKGGWSDKPTQYHIQTDEGPERFFRYQTLTGQYRKEKRLEDGTVVGTYGWVDPNGLLRLRDYVADNAGYRIVKTRNIFVGIGGGKEALAATPPTPTAQTVTVPPAPTTTAAPPSTIQPIYSPPPSVYPTYQQGYQKPTTYRPHIQGTYDSSPQYDHRPYDNGPSYQQENYEQNSVYPQYDGVSTYHNGFRYYLPRQYHEEDTSPAAGGGEERAGSFGYIDPFGIRRVVYYNTRPGTGFLHRKNNRYVGFNSTPYDPRY